jgi:hypothetical protein
LRWGGGGSIDEGIAVDCLHNVYRTETSFTSELVRKRQIEGKEEEAENKEGMKKERKNRVKKKYNANFLSIL